MPVNMVVILHGLIAQASHKGRLCYDMRLCIVFHLHIEFLHIL